MMNQTLCNELEAAMECELVVKALDLLVAIAELHADQGNTASAAEIAALVMEYPVRPATHERADALFTRLEGELCPRVIYDARTLAAELTLDDMVQRVLADARKQGA